MVEDKTRVKKPQQACSSISQKLVPFLLGLSVWFSSWSPPGAEKNRNKSFHVELCMRLSLNTLVYECDTFLLSMRSASCFWKCLSLSCFSRSASSLCRDSSSSFCYTNISRRVLHSPDETVWREWRTPLIWPVSGVGLPPLSLSDSALPPASSPPPPSTFSPPLPDAEPPPLSLPAPLLCAEPFPPWLACDQISRKSLVCLAALGPAMCTLSTASTPRLLLLLPALLLLSLPLFAGQPAVLSQDSACLLWVCGACWGLVEWRTDHTLWKQSDSSYNWMTDVTAAPCRSGTDQWLQLVHCWVCSDPLAEAVAEED